jgi:hypothetical protein
MKAKSVLTAGALLLLPLSAKSAVLANYTFSNSTGVSTGSTANVTAGTFDASAGITGSTLDASSNPVPFNGYSTATVSNSGTAAASSPTRFVRGTADSTTLNAAVSGGDYFSFTVTAANGYFLDLTTLSFDYSGNGAGSGGTATSNTASFGISTSIGGLSTLIGTASVTQSGSTAAAYQRYTLNFDDPSFAGAYNQISGPLELRIYLANSATNASSVARLDNVIINGDVLAVPEPSSMLLAGLGLTGLLGIRRRF